MSENHADNGNESNEFTEEQVNEAINRDINKIVEEKGVSEEEALKIHSQRLFGQKLHFQKKAIDPETGKSYKELLEERKAAQDKDTDHDNQTHKKSADSNDEDDVKKDVQILKLSEEKRKFGYQHNLSPEEQDFVYSYATGAGVSPEDALKSPFVKSGLDALRKEKDNNDATPNPSFRSPKVGGKSFEEMDKKEKSKNYSELVKAITKK